MADQVSSMRTIALINQKGGVGKTTSTANLGAALARAGQRTVVVDLDPQANLSMHLGVEVGAEEPSTYGLLVGRHDFASAVRPIDTNLSLVPSHLDLSGAEMELAGAFGREILLREAIELWQSNLPPEEQVDFVLIDCPPSLGLLSVNGLMAAKEAFIALQTEFFALQGMSKLVEIVQLLKRRMNPDLEITGILPCLYDPRLRLAREVLGEIRKYFPDVVFRTSIRTNVKLAEAPSYGQTIFQYAPESNGAKDYEAVATEVLARASGDQPESPDKDAAPEEKPAEPQGTPAKAQVETQVESPAEPKPKTPTLASEAPKATETSAAPEPSSTHETDSEPDQVPEPASTSAKPAAEPQAQPASQELSSTEEIRPTASPDPAAPSASETPAAPIAPIASGGMIMVPTRGRAPFRQAQTGTGQPTPPRAKDLPQLPQDVFPASSSSAGDPPPSS